MASGQDKREQSVRKGCQCVPGCQPYKWLSVLGILNIKEEEINYLRFSICYEAKGWCRQIVECKQNGDSVRAHWKVSTLQRQRTGAIKTHMCHFATFQSNKSSLIIIILCDICANSFQRYAVHQKGVWDPVPCCRSNRCPDSQSEWKY